MPPSPTTARTEIAAPVDARTFIVEFNRLTSLFSQFSKQLGEHDSDKRAATLFTEVSRNCDIFLKQAAVHLSCVAPQLDSRASATSSQLHRSGRALLNSWRAFIEAQGKCEGEGLGPYVVRIHQSFEEIFQAIVTLRENLPIRRFRTDTSCITLQNFQDQVLLLREEIAAVLRRPSQERFEGFNPQIFQKRIALLMHAVSDLFDRALLHVGLTVAVTISSRTTISSSIAAIGVALQMAWQSEDAFNAMRERVFEVNQELTKLFGKLRFPFAIEIVLREQNGKKV
jgi:hypothetical protein